MNRDRFVERLQRQLEWDGWPRLVLFLIVSGAGMLAFLTSFAFLHAGYDSMALRYAIAGGTGYLAFLLLLGGYVRWRRRFAFDGPDAIDGIDLLNVGPDIGEGVVNGTDAIGRFAGGRSGGGGAADSWGSSSSSGSGGSWFDGDADLGWVLVALAVAFAGVLAVGYVIWIAPALLAEVLVDAAIVGAVSRRVMDDGRDWTATAVRKTWFPAVLLILTVAIGGWALQQAAPEARSIGPAMRAIFG